MIRNEDKNQNDGKTKVSELGVDLQISMWDSGIGSDALSPKNVTTFISSTASTAFPFDFTPPTHQSTPPTQQSHFPTHQSNHPKPQKVPPTHQTDTIIEEITCEQTTFLSRDASSLHRGLVDIGPVICEGGFNSPPKSVFNPTTSQSNEDSKDINNNNDNSNNNNDNNFDNSRGNLDCRDNGVVSHCGASVARRRVMRGRLTQFSSHDCPNASDTSPTPTRTTTRSKSTQFYTDPLSTSPPTTPSFWYTLSGQQRRCSVELVDLAIRGASQKHVVFTPPRVDSSIALDTLELESSLRKPRSNHPRATSTDLVKMLSHVEREVGVGLRIVSDVVHINQTGLGYGYHVDEHPSLMYNRAYSRSFPGAPSLPAYHGDDDDLLGCQGFKRKKDRASKIW